MRGDEIELVVEGSPGLIRLGGASSRPCVQRKRLGHVARTTLSTGSLSSPCRSSDGPPCTQTMPSVGRAKGEWWEGGGDTNSLAAFIAASHSSLTIHFIIISWADSRSCNPLLLPITELFPIGESFT